MKIKTLCIALFLMDAIACSAQKTLSTADSTYLAILQTELTLTPEQRTQADSLISLSSQKITEYERELLRISRSGIAQEEKDSQQRELREKKKNEKENRDLSIVLLLTSEQRKIYAERIKPSKPGVLHMGITHDRAKCEVCVVK